MTLLVRIKQIVASNVLGVPAYMINNLVVYLILAHFQASGVLNIRATWIGDIVGIGVNSAILPYWIRIMKRLEEKRSSTPNDSKQDG